MTKKSARRRCSNYESCISPKPFRIGDEAPCSDVSPPSACQKARHQRKPVASFIHYVGSALRTIKVLRFFKGEERYAMRNLTNYRFHINARIMKMSCLSPMRRCKMIIFLQRFVFTVLFALSLSAVSTNAICADVAGGAIEASTEHIEAALKAINAKEIEAAQDHIKAARQSAKKIIGGSFEVKAQRGSSAISKARRQLNKDDPAGATASLNRALEIFNSMKSLSEKGGRGGLK